MRSIEKQVQIIVRHCAEEFGVEENKVYDKYGNDRVRDARKIAIYIIRENCYLKGRKLTYQYITNFFNTKTHDTALHSYKKAKSYIKRYAEYNQAYLNIMQRINKYLTHPKNNYCYPKKIKCLVPVLLTTWNRIIN